MNEFEGKVVVVTGAGGGIGRAHALAFAATGARLVVNDLGGTVDGTGASDSAERVAMEINEAGGDAIANSASVCDKQGAMSIIQDAVDAYGTVDILVNNAGILRDRSFKNMTLEDWDLVMDVHMNGTAYVTHAAWKIMYAKNFGRIICTSSASGIFGNFGQANYGEAKMAMIGFMNVLALEGASHNIKVNCLAPRAATRMIGTIPGRNVSEKNPPEEMRPELVAPAALFLCTDDAPSGKIIEASGGHFSTVGVFSNEGVNFGLDVDLDSVLTNQEKILDMGKAIEGWYARRSRSPEPFSRR